MAKHRVLLADDHTLFREAVRTLLEREQDIEIVGEARDGIEAVELAGSMQPHVVVLDIRMPGLNGVEAIRQLVAAHPAIKVIVCSHSSAPPFAAAMLGAGAHGCVAKEDADTLPQEIRAAMGGSERPI